MGAITAKSLREKTSQELQDQWALERKRLFDGVVKSASGEAIKPHEKREGRRLLARIQSVLRERALRKQLDGRITDLGVKAQKAEPAFTKLVKNVEKRASDIKAELAKPVGERKDKPMLKRIRPKNSNINLSDTPSNRAAVRLAEATRLRACLQRDDIGEGK